VRHAPNFSSRLLLQLRLLLLSLALVLTGVSASAYATDTYDAPSNVLTIPKVVVDPTTYSSVKITVGNILSVGGGAAAADHDTYSFATNKLAIPSVLVGSTLYTNVVITVKSILSAALPVKKSSYENRMAAIQAIGPQLPPLTGDALAYADFFQDGTYSYVIHSLEYNNQDPSTANKFGHIYFYRKINGAWVESTKTLLADNTGCLHPRKAVVADFNGDGKPDIFFACHGFDASPYPGEQQHILLSQPDGSYQNITTAFSCFCHGASAGDLNNDGYPDVVVADQMVAQTPYVLINNGNGTFAQDFNRLPADLKNRQIYSVELIDFDNTGKLDLWLGGNEPNAYPYPAQSLLYPTIFRNDGQGSFVAKAPLTLPADITHGEALDIVYDSGYIYLLRTSDYTTAAIQKITYPSLTSSLIYSHTGAYSFGAQWIDWIGLYQGNIVSPRAEYQLAVPK